MKRGVRSTARHDEGRIVNAVARGVGVIGLAYIVTALLSGAVAQVAPAAPAAQAVTPSQLLERETDARSKAAKEVVALLAEAGQRSCCRMGGILREYSIRRTGADFV